MERKHQGLPPPKKFKRVSSAGKVMASIFWDSQGVIRVNYLGEGRTINGAYFAEKKRKVDSRCSALARQCTSPHLSSY